jgi:hypothetical protein
MQAISVIVSCTQRGELGCSDNRPTKKLGGRALKKKDEQCPAPVLREKIYILSQKKAHAEIRRGLANKARCEKVIYLSRLIITRAIDPCCIYWFCAQYYNPYSRIFWKAKALLKKMIEPPLLSSLSRKSLFFVSSLIKYRISKAASS